MSFRQYLVISFMSASIRVNWQQKDVHHKPSVTIVAKCLNPVIDTNKTENISFSLFHKKDNLKLKISFTKAFLYI